MRFCLRVWSSFCSVRDETEPRIHSACRYEGGRKLDGPAYAKLRVRQAQLHLLLHSRHEHIRRFLHGNQVYLGILPRKFNSKAAFSAADFKVQRVVVPEDFSAVREKLLGKSVYLAALGSVIYATGVAENYAISQPAADFAGEKTVLPRLGTLTITEGA